MSPDDPIVLELDSPDRKAEEHGYTQRLAGFELWSSRAFGPDARPALRPTSRALAVDATWNVVHDEPGLDQGELRRVVTLKSAAGQRRVDYADGESFVVAADGGWIWCRQRPAGAENLARSMERALGAPLILALAVRGVHVLHASALLAADQVIAFTAASGVGKSTVAAAGERSPEGGWRRVADDLLAVRLGAEVVALPHFPQLKLPAQEQYPQGAPASLPLRALVELERGAAGSPIRIDALDPAPAALALARATVAARWFDAELLAPHLAACAAGALALRVAHLHYPSGLERVEEVLKAVARDLV